MLKDSFHRARISPNILKVQIIGRKCHVIFRGRSNPLTGGSGTSHVADEGIEMQSDWSSVRSITDSDRGDREVIG